MSKFVFRLQSFLNIKEKLEEQKKTEYGKAVVKLEEAKLVLQNIFDTKKNTIICMQNSINTSINSNELQNFNTYLSFLDKEVVRQNEVIELEQKNVENARLQLVEAMKQRKMIETLKEKEKEEFFKEELKKEQKMIDELVSFKYNNQS